MQNSRMKLFMGYMKMNDACRSGKRISPLTQFYLITGGTFLLSMVLYGAIWHDAPVKTNDSPAYLLLAADLVDFQLETLHDRTPGYPLFLLVSGSIGEPTRALFYMQLILHFISISLCLHLLHRLSVSWTGMIIFLIVALLPLYSERATYVLTENFTQFLLVGGGIGIVLWFMDRRFFWLFPAGICLAFAGITRPTYQYLSLLFAVLILVLQFSRHWQQERTRLLFAILVLTGFTIMIPGGLAFYNAQHFGFWGLTPYSGFNLSGKTARVLERLPLEYSPVREVLIKYRDEGLLRPHGAHSGAGYIWEPHAQAELQEVTGMDRIELSEYMLEINLLLIRSAPMEYLAEVGYAFVTYWFPPNDDMANMNSRPLQLIWSLVHFAVISLFALQLILLFGFLILIVNIPVPFRTAWVENIPHNNHRFLTFLFALSIIGLTAAVSTILQTGDMRFRVPTDLLILLVTVIGVDTLLFIRQTILQLNISNR